jgi:glycosyltransferase involved in cell wall biosynthesis
MKTLLFAPLWLGEDRVERNKKWLNYYSSLNDKLEAYEILLVDNGSDEGRLKEFAQFASTLKVPVTIISCHVHISRTSHREYEYWYRAFRVALVYAMDNKFDKILHIDSDVYVLSSRLASYINNLDSGWNTFWCRRHNFPESTFQVIVKDEFMNALKFFTIDYLKHFGKDDAENIIPFTNVNRFYVGDRYGETNTEQTNDMDFYCQTPNHRMLTFRR